MRQSKSRSRNKSNRNRSVGNVVNRVFDSSGPEGKVRGTPQQIIDKFTQLARDAQLGNDRVAFENFQQHAEHYQRMLNEAQREQEARREEHERQNRDRQADRDRGQRDGGQRDGGQRDGGQRDGGQRDGGQRDTKPGEDQHGDPARSPQPDIIDPADRGESTLVETPEARGGRGENKDEGKPESKGEGNAPRKPARKPRSRKQPGKSGGDGGQGSEGSEGGPDLSAGPAKAAE